MFNELPAGKQYRNVINVDSSRKLEVKLMTAEEKLANLKGSVNNNSTRIGNAEGRIGNAENRFRYYVPFGQLVKRKHHWEKLIIHPY